ncbi:MAG: hypothetical protein MI747_01340 [Desulfobacterales bacterium]|nr:hypothetical protein [Desulfobacterales bacterium]
MALIYLVFGIFSGVVCARVHQSMKSGKIRFAWFHWVALGIWYPSVVGLIAFIVTSIEESEPQAAGMALLIFGGVLLALTLGGYRLLFKPTMVGESSESV